MTIGQEELVIRREDTGLGSLLKKRREFIRSNRSANVAGMVAVGMRTYFYGALAHDLDRRWHTLPGEVISKRVTLLRSLASLVDAIRPWEASGLTKDVWEQALMGRDAHGQPALPPRTWRSLKQELSRHLEAGLKETDLRVWKGIYSSAPRARKSTYRMKLAEYRDLPGAPCYGLNNEEAARAEVKRVIADASTNGSAKRFIGVAWVLSLLGFMANQGDAQECCGLCVRRPVRASSYCKLHRVGSKAHQADKKLRDEGVHFWVTDHPSFDKWIRKLWFAESYEQALLFDAPIEQEKNLPRIRRALQRCPNVRASLCPEALTLNLHELLLELRGKLDSQEIVPSTWPAKIMGFELMEYIRRDSEEAAQWPWKTQELLMKAWAICHAHPVTVSALAILLEISRRKVQRLIAKDELLQDFFNEEGVRRISAKEYLALNDGVVLLRASHVLRAPWEKPWLPLTPQKELWRQQNAKASPW